MEPGTVPALHGAPMTDCFGALIGVVEDLLIHVQSNRPVWLVVALAGDSRRTIVPHAGSRAAAGGMRTSFPGERVRSCPVDVVGGSVGLDEALPACRHYEVRVAAGDLEPVRGPRHVPARDAVTVPAPDAIVLRDARVPIAA